MRRDLIETFSSLTRILTDPSGDIMSNAPANPPLDAAEFVKSQIRTVSDWPLPGVQFRDITPLLQHPKTLRVLIDLFVQRYIDVRLDYVAGLDARGFIIGPIL